MRPWPPVEQALRADRSMRHSLQELFRFANPAHAREYILHRKLMGHGTDAGHRIFHEDELIASIEGGTGGTTTAVITVGILAPIPTLSQWTLLMLGLLMLVVTGVTLRSRRNG